MSNKITATGIYAVIITVLAMVLWLSATQRKDAQLQAEDTIISLEKMVNILTDDNAKLVEQIIESQAEETTTEEIKTSSNVLLSCTPGEQPTQHAGNYSGNSQILNNRLAGNTCSFLLSEKPSENAVLKVKTAKPTTTKNQVFMKFFNQPVAWRLVSEEGSHFIVYNLNDIEIVTKTAGTISFDWLSKMKTGENMIGWYVAIFDGNYIESIEIVD